MLAFVASPFAPRPSLSDELMRELLAGLDPAAQERALSWAIEPSALGGDGQPLPMYEYDADANRLTLRLHEGQREAWEAEEPRVLMQAGTQGGKTSFAAPWLLAEMQREEAGDYLFVSPTFRLLDLKALPEFRRLFVDTLALGKLTEGNAPRFVMSPEGERRLFGRTRRRQEPETRVLFGHAQDPDSLESATAKGAVLDEAGQKKFKRGSYEAVERRLSIHQGRALLPTTPYTLGWLKGMHDMAGAPGTERARASGVGLVQFESTMNPAFPVAEFERQRAALPAWKFNMMYRGRFERPAGMIYDVFDRTVHLTESAPTGGARFAGLDFGGVNTAAVEVTQRPRTLCYVVTRAYHAGSRTAKEHATALAPAPSKAWGGAGSEDNWRREFGGAAYPITKPPVGDVEVGIDRVYALLKNHPGLSGHPDPSGTGVIVHDPARPYLELLSGAPGVADLADDLEAYARELNDDDEPTEKIEDKETWHRLDALRYLATGLVSPPSTPTTSRVSAPLRYRPTGRR